MKQTDVSRAKLVRSLYAGLVASVVTLGVSVYGIAQRVGLFAALVGVVAVVAGGMEIAALVRIHREQPDGANTTQHAA